MENNIIELIKKMVTDGVISQEVAEKYCPELKESEDEKIRKELIKFVRVNISDEERYIVWLEKQGKKEFSWSEEDEGYMDRILEALYDYYPKRYAQSIYDWLESLKKSMKGE